MYMMYDSVLSNGKQTCTSAMDCESPCNSQSSLQQHQQQLRHGISSRKAAWGAASSSSSSLTSPPRSISPSNYGLSSNSLIPPSQRVTRSSATGHLSNSGSMSHLLMLDPSLPASGMLTGKTAPPSAAFSNRSGHSTAPSTQ